jgi:hypothetical protein
VLPTIQGEAAVSVHSFKAQNHGGGESKEGRKATKAVRSPPLRSGETAAITHSNSGSEGRFDMLDGEYWEGSWVGEGEEGR